MLNLIKASTTNKKKYSEEYWKVIQDIAYDEKNNFGQFIISYFFDISKNKVLNEETWLVIKIMQSLYPFKDEQINLLTRSVSNCIFSLNTIIEQDLVKRRDHFLYCIMDTLFHNPEMICDVNNESIESLFLSIFEAINLNYDTTVDYTESYYKNYTVIQFINYFKDKKLKVQLIDNFLNHFDSRIIEDMNFELKEYYTFQYYHKK